MKKKIFMLLTMVCCMTGLAACGSSNQEAEIRETVDGFYTASQAGDYSAMRDFVTGDFDALEEFLELGDLEQILEDYRAEHTEELDALEAAEGEDAVTAEIFNRLFPDTFAEAAENVAGLADVEMRSELILVQQEGKWLINEMKGDGVSADGN